ncbi:MAG: hypothetical protein P1R58_11160 [bacterium]|nr:hypothetical protein [bacterium]
MTKRILSFLVGLYIVVLAGSVSAVPSLDHRLDRGGVGLKLGLFHSTTMHIKSKRTDIGDREFIWKAGFNGGPFFDIRLGRGNFVSVAVELHDVQLMDDREKLLDLNLGYKATIYVRNHRLAYRPGISAGFGYISKVGFIEKVNLVTARAFVEMVFLSHPKYSYLVEFSVGMLPDGSGILYDVTSNPYVMLRGGILL